ncbi:MAG: c-type cytochrome domain-containing protein, partial [Phycisphaeraceae bacterium]|nr:c-type cytochrome domain-containing protein [Phycisphaeraceae bacterium]
GQDWYAEPWREKKPPMEVKIKHPIEDGKIDFVEHVVPIFQAKCIECHGTKKKAKGGFIMTNAEGFFAGGNTTQDEGWSIVTRGSRELDEEKNQFLYSMRHEDPEFIMPPEKEKNPVTDQQMKILTDWVEQGANWPEGYVIPEP